MAVQSTTMTIRTRLFDADRTDREIELDAQGVASVKDRQLLWVDALISDDRIDDADLLTLLPFDGRAVARMWASPPAPRLAIHGDYFLVRVVALREERTRDESVVLDLAVTRNVVLTTHREPIPFLDDLDERIRGDTTLGAIDSTDFATVLLDGLVTSYLELTDSILARVDRLDGEALRSTPGSDLLGALVALRHRIAAVRRVLVAHRTVMASLAGADFQVITRTDTAGRFATASERFEAATSAIDTAREALLGTFDIHMSVTAQRTNDTMKILTVVSVLLLPSGVIAGFMGMNLKAPYSNDDPSIFWIVIAVIVLLAALTMVTLRVRRWI